MEPTRAPWATGGPAGTPAYQSPVADPQGAKAPWAKAHARRLDVTIKATPKWPDVFKFDAGDSQDWVPATKQILSVDILESFLKSRPMESFMNFILYLNGKALGRPISAIAANQCSEAIGGLLGVLQALDRIVDGTPPAEHRLRYGNPAFRTWMAAMITATPSLLRPLLAPATDGEVVAPAGLVALPELASYFVDSFGNATRIDYGTGHETTFVAFLYCLARLGVLRASDASALVLRVFPRYLELMRRLQTTYWLEPAGSHGVWGLDDYQFFPFLWGSAQLVEHPDILPGSIHSEAAVREGAGDYLYLAAVAFVLQVKKGPLAQTSPMLTDVSALPSWTRVNKGMIKMYQAEVLCKFPIMQHFLTGRLIPVST